MMVAKAGIWQLSGTDIRWKLAPALIEFMAQADQYAPKRSHRTDGSIASEGHYKNSPRSDHNPKPGPHKTSWVTAVDLTHDPKGGLDCQKVADALRHSQDERIKYVIYDKRIFNSPHFKTAGARARGPWHWGKYTGYDPHTGHLHLSIWMEDVEKTAMWGFPGVVLPKPGSEYTVRTARTADKPAPAPAPADRGVGVSANHPVVNGGWSGDDIAWLRNSVQHLRSARATDRSLTYALRFYRVVAAEAGIDGSKPELVAKWLLDRLRGDDDGREPHPVG